MFKDMPQQMHHLILFEFHLLKPLVVSFYWEYLMLDSYIDKSNWDQGQGETDGQRKLKKS